MFFTPNGGITWILAFYLKSPYHGELYEDMFVSTGQYGSVRIATDRD